jgi:N utilization substance protein B
MGIRRAARERAVQFLFQYDLNPPKDLDAALGLFWENQPAPPPAPPARPGSQPPAETSASSDGSTPPARDPEPASSEIAAIRQFADPLIRGTIEHRDTIDDWIQRFVKNWELHRIAAVDRNVLRLALYEMLHRQDIPPVVSINEAVDIAKRFSTEDSGKFVNGVLDRIRHELLRPARS